MRWYLLLVLLVALGVSCGGSDPTRPPTPEPTATSAPTTTSSKEAAELTTTPSGLQYRDLVVGTGEDARTGATAVVHYTGWLEDGTKFDSSVDRGQTFDFVIGQGQVIKGWDEGVATMKVGGKRELIIPPDLAYGDRGAGSVIPPGATLKFEVELIALR
ncbi:MAG: FKBP-type peptidyl-prolyl cis-trans isomerase [Chloroflexi bacterium]|nr:FKBP-type peptidyl-prolyl cis-trans isomerase [Chloroflexota bacterium]MCH8224750.1 FKBP-type peptidyl-prolyl cis-trans isomerase [Chloroflexota bacterium]MCI0846534.1 FKBP-type peptidyl-prolyl cis-trans isomerase [Chloroflexota bacterium]